VATDKKKLMFFQDEGIQLEQEIKRESNISSMAWHPSKIVLFCGCEDGKLFIWKDYSSKVVDIENSPHESIVNNVIFNTLGNRVVSSDEKFNAVVWNYEFEKNELTKLCQYAQKFEIEALYFPSFNIEKFKE